MQPEAFKIRLQQDDDLNPGRWICPTYKERVSTRGISAIKHEASKSPPKPVQERGKPSLAFSSHNLEALSPQGRLKHQNPSLSSYFQTWMLQHGPLNSGVGTWGSTPRSEQWSGDSLAKSEGAPRGERSSRRGRLRAWLGVMSFKSKIKGTSPTF